MIGILMISCFQTITSLSLYTSRPSLIVIIMITINYTATVFIDDFFILLCHIFVLASLSSIHAESFSVPAIGADGGASCPHLTRIGLALPPAAAIRSDVMR